MITPADLTDEMIRSVQRDVYRAGDHELEYVCSDARRVGVAKISKGRAVARLKLCEYLNTRNKP